MARGRHYEYMHIDRAKEAQDDWYLQRRKEIGEEDGQVQTKLEISQPGDTHEVEAESIARNFVNGGNASLNSVTPVSSSVQTKSDGSSEFTDSNFTSQLNASKGSGQSLDDSTRSQMESKMGADLGGVKIHTGGAAHAMSESINAKAFTHGSDIYFKNGNYDTQTDSGKELLAHEVVHTQQQGSGVSRMVQRTPEHVDNVVREVSEILGYEKKRKLKTGDVNAESKDSIEAYLLIQQMSPDDIEDFYLRYPQIAAEIDENLPIEFRRSAGFGFFKGVSDEEKDKIIILLNDPETWKDDSLLDMTLSMAVQAFRIIDYVNRKITIKDDVLNSVNSQTSPTLEQQKILTGHGFVDGKFELDLVPPELTPGFTYGRVMKVGLGAAGKNFWEKAWNSIKYGWYWLMGKLRSKTGWNVAKKINVTNVSLADFQDAFAGALGGMHFTTQRNSKGKRTKDATDGFVNLSVDFEDGTALVSSDALPFDSINYQGSTYTFNSGAGNLKVLTFKMNWAGRKTRKKEKAAKNDLQFKAVPEGFGEIELHLNEFSMNNLRMVSPTDTFGIGSLKLSDVTLRFKQNFGPQSGLDEMSAFLLRVMSVLADASALLTAGIQMSMYRFTAPGNKDDVESRKATQSGLAKIMQNEFASQMNFDLHIGGMELKNYVSVDKDISLNDLGGRTDKGGTPKVSKIASIVTGDLDISLISAGVDPANENELFAKKSLLLEKQKKLITVTNDYNFYKNYSGVGSEGDRKERKKNRQANTKFIELQKEKSALETDIAKLNHEILVLQPNQSFDLSISAKRFNTSGAGMMDELMGSMFEDYASDVTGFENKDNKIDQITFKTNFNQFGLSNTSVELRDINIPSLQLDGIHYTTEANDFHLTAVKGVLTAITGTVKIGFNDQKGALTWGGLQTTLDDMNMQLGDFYVALDMEMHPDKDGSNRSIINLLHQKIKKLSENIVAIQLGITGAGQFPDAVVSNYNAYGISNEIDLLNRDMLDIYGQIDWAHQPHLGGGNPKYTIDKLLADANVLKNKITERKNALSQELDLLKGIYLETLNIEKLELDRLILEFPNKNLKAVFPDNKMIELLGFNARNVLIDFSSGKTEIKVGELNEPAHLGLQSSNVPDGTVVSKNVNSSEKQIETSLNQVKAGAINIDVLKNGDISYSLQSLFGGGQLTQFGEPDKKSNLQTGFKSFFDLPELITMDPLISGTISKGKITSKINLPSIQIPSVDIQTTDFSLFVPATGKHTSFDKITADIELERNPVEDAKNPFTAFTVKTAGIDKFTSYGLKLQYKKIHVNIPSDVASTISGMKLENLRMESTYDAQENKVVWDRKGSTRASITGMDFSKGLSFEIENKLAVLLTRASSDAMWFEFLETGGFAYDINNLDAAGAFWMKNKKGQKEIDLTGLIDTKHLGGSLESQVIGDGDDMRTKYVLTGTDIDIPEISFKPFDLISGQYEFHIPSSAAQKTIIQGIKGNYVVTLLSPSVKEKKHYEYLAGVAKRRSKTAETEKERKDFALESEMTAPWDINFHVDNLSIDKIKSYGLHFIAREETKVKPSDEVMRLTENYFTNQMTEKTYDLREYEKKVFDLQLRDDASATINKLKLSGFDVHIPKEQGKTVSFSGKANIGDAKNKGIDIGPNTLSLSSMHNEIVKETFTPVFNDKTRKKGKDSFTTSLSVQQIVFEGSTEDVYTLTVDDPKIFFPETQSGKNVTMKEEDIWLEKSTVSGISLNAISRDLPVFQAGSIVVSRQKVLDENKNPQTDVNGNFVYKTVIKIEKPHLQDISFASKREDDVLEGEVMAYEIVVGGELDGTLVIEKGTSDFTVLRGDENKDIFNSFIVSAEKPDEKLTFSKMEARVKKKPVTPPTLEDKTNMNVNRPADDYEAVNNYTPTGDYNFLNAVTGNITMHMFGQQVQTAIVNVDEPAYRYESKMVRDGEGGSVDEGKYVQSGMIKGTGYIDLNSVLSSIETILESRKGKEIIENPWWALTNISATEENGNLVIAVTAGSTKPHIIICPNYATNVLNNGKGREYVKLSALVDYQMNKPDVDFAIPGADSKADRAQADVQRMKESDFLGFGIDFNNVTLNLEKLKSDNLKEQDTRRGLLRILTGNESVTLNGSVTFSNSLSTPGHANFRTHLEVGKVKLPAFRYPVKENWTNSSDMIVSGKHIELESLTMDAFTTTASYEQWLTNKLSVTGLKMEIRDRPRKLRNERTMPVQKKSLFIGSVNDPLEHEADSIASKVANGQNADLTGVQRFFSGVQRKEKEEEAPLDLVDSLHSASGGQSMDETTRTEMESKMGVDFSGVKIHTGNEADTYNQQVNAKAFTYGQDIYFRNGQYNTHSKAGKELLAHELVHTVQQGEGIQRKIQRQPQEERHVVYNRILQNHKEIVDRYGLQETINQYEAVQLQQTEKLLDLIAPDVQVGHGQSTSILFEGRRYDAMIGNQRLVIVDAPEEQPHVKHQYALDLNGKFLSFVYYRNPAADASFNAKFGPRPPRDAEPVGTGAYTTIASKATQSLTGISSRLGSSSFRAKTYWNDDPVLLETLNGTGPALGYNAEKNTGSQGIYMQSIQDNLATLSGKYDIDATETRIDYFGPTTKQAVINYQLKKGIVPASGNVGPLTLRAMDNDCYEREQTVALGRKLRKEAMIQQTSGRIDYNVAGWVIYQIPPINAEGLAKYGINASDLKFTYIERPIEKEARAYGGCRYTVEYRGIFMGNFDLQRTDAGNTGVRTKEETQAYKDAYSSPVVAPWFRSQLDSGKAYRIALSVFLEGGDPDFMSVLVNVGFPNSPKGGSTAEDIDFAAWVELGSHVINYNFNEQMNKEKKFNQPDAKVAEPGLQPIKTSNFDPKISSQMSKRGWTKTTINQTVNFPETTRTSTNKANGNPATAYYNLDGTYVVRDNVTGDIIQISDKFDANWVSDPTIVNPYIPPK